MTADQPLHGRRRATSYAPEPDASLTSAEAQEVAASGGARRAGGDAVAVALGYLASFAYPLVSLPFLSRVVGTGNLGRLMFALSILQLVVFTVDFGFNASALRRVATARDKEERSRIVAATLGAKSVLWVLCSVILMAIVLVVPSMRELWVMYAGGLLLIGIGALYPSFLLQGVGRAKQFALFTAVSRLVALALLLLTVRGPGDLALAMLWQQFPLALSALLSWAMVLWHWHDARLVRTTVAAVREAFSDSGSLFVSNIAVLMMGSANTVVLGIVSTTVQVAFFGSGERFSNAARGVLRGVVDAMLPRMTAKIPGVRRVQQLITVGVMGAFTLAGVAIILNAPWFVPWYLGRKMQGTVPVMQLMGAALPLVGITSALQLHVTAQHRFSTIARLSGVGGLFHLVLLIPASWLWGALGAAVALVVSEGFLALLYVIDARWYRRTHRRRPTHLYERAAA